MMLPDAALNQHLAIIGRTGSGKTFAAKGFVEHLLDLKRRVCIIDPTDAWHGLRSSADGHKAGYPVVVFGGDHADVPINARSGHALAEFVANQNAPCIIATADMRIDERRQFMADFLDAVYRLNKVPLHLIIDEADEIGPQNPMPDTKVVLHRVDRIVRRGRIKGFRVMMITQRPAVLNKNLLTQAASLIVMRLMSPQDRKAIDAWIEGQGDVVKGKEVTATMATLKRGEGWVWAPEFNVLHRVKFPQIKTFDSSRAPEEGETVEPTRFADVDLSAVRSAFADAEKEAEANDPKLLRKRIAELERDARGGKVTDAAVQSLEDDARSYDRGRQQGFAEGLLVGRADGMNALVDELDPIITHVADAFKKLTAVATKVMVPVSPQTIEAFVTHSSTQRPKPAAPPRKTNGAGEEMPNPQRKLLTVLAQYPQGRTKKQLAILAGYAHNGGAFGNPLSNLRSRGWAEGGPGRIVITPAGIAALGSWEPLPTGRELQEYWFANLDAPPAKLLRALCEVYPNGLSKEELARRCGYEPSGGAFGNPLSRLRSLELAEGRGGAPIRASDDLFG